MNKDIKMTMRQLKEKIGNERWKTDIDIAIEEAGKNGEINVVRFINGDSLDCRRDNLQKIIII